VDTGVIEELGVLVGVLPMGMVQEGQVPTIGAASAMAGQAHPTSLGKDTVSSEKTAVDLDPLQATMVTAASGEGGQGELEQGLNHEGVHVEVWRRREVEGAGVASVLLLTVVASQWQHHHEISSPGSKYNQVSPQQQPSRSSETQNFFVISSARNNKAIYTAYYIF
jgi:hypothetical protein